MVVDAVVVDRAGAPVHGLSPQDFNVELDGHRAGVKAAEFVTYGIARDLGDPKHAGGGRVVLIVVDDLGTAAGEGHELLASLERAISQFAPGDLVGLATTSGLGPLVPPTTDRRPLLAALHSRQLTGRRVQGPVLVTFKEAMEIAADVRGVAQAVLSRECKASPAACDGGTRMAARAALAEGEGLEDQQFATLAQLIAALSEMPAPRILLFLTPGVPLGVTGGASDRFGALVRSAAARYVQVYSLTETPDIVDASSSPERAKARYVNSEFLFAGVQSVARALGGASFRVIGQGDRFVTRILNETSAQYRLSIEVPVGTRRDRPVSLRVRLSQADVEVRASSQVVVASTQPAVQPLEQRITAFLAQGGTAFGVPMAFGIALRAAGDRTQLGFDVAVPNEVAGPLAVSFVAIDKNGGVVASGKRLVPVPPSNDDYRVSSSFVVSPGTITLRMVSADAHGNIGSREQTVSTALVDFDGLRSSGLFLTCRPTNGASRLLAADIVPRSTEVIEPTVEFYPNSSAAAALPTVHFSAVEDSTGTLAYEEDVTAQRDSALLAARGTWRVNGLAPGGYTLSATVSDGHRLFKANTVGVRFSNQR